MISLLPPNATPLERALEAGLLPLGRIDRPIAQLWDPMTCAVELMPWLAWSLSVDSWDPAWSEAVKRQAIAESIPLHRIKGTRLSVEKTIGRIDDRATIVEWHEQTPAAEPHTFDIILPLDAEGGARATAAFAEAIIAEVAKVKPLREHVTLVQALTANTTIGFNAIARPMLARRDDAILIDDRSQPWSVLLQTEDGEPLQSDDGSFLDTRP